MNHILKLSERLNELGYLTKEITSEALIPINNVHLTKAVKQYQDDNFDKLKISKDSVQYGVATPDTLDLIFAGKNQNYVLTTYYSIDLIIYHEISGEAYYNKRLKRPMWPGGISGVTIGIGYDLAHHTKTEIERDWSPYVSKSVIQRLQAVQGLAGKSAQERIKSLADISIPYDASYKVFIEISVPKYLKLALARYPNLKTQVPDLIGGILSVVYNRGTSVTGASRKEMANLVTLINNNTDEDKVAQEITNMKRLWVDTGLNGLLTRRDDEAKLVKNSRRLYEPTEIVKVYY